ncbi:MFS transporter [Beggiatoa leptomitoformis]|uniref:MFS transporter n=1 Tax=Beggiatoa leptomitoformis TaxID=288004 RepID=A0A2N9YES2_9GAMM|nr:MFS transporter [Beggiatoa leptomitoformis]ALG68666.1 MFS transporter [Beggiatoa leptomitoformis]AUI68982.1 MFS transporter [Beggiatoa leptomitoformis]
MSQRNIISILICGVLLVSISMGIRQTFGIFLRPITLDLNMSREMVGLALAMQNLLWGVVQPFVGYFADRYGSMRIMFVSGLLYSVGLLLTTLSYNALTLQLTLGMLVGLGLSGVTFAVVLGAVGRAVSAERRSLALGIVTAGGSFGMFIFVPAGQALLSTTGWISTFVVMALSALLMPLLALGFAQDKPARTQNSIEQSLKMALREAHTHSGFWLLNLGFFVCGFHVAFIAIHLPSYLTDKGLTPMTGATALALIGFFNILGSYAFGWLGGRYRQKYVLSWLYFIRAIVLSLFIYLPITHYSALIFAATMGFLWLGTVPLTSGLVARIFGTQYFAMLFGIVFFSHQVGSFLGAWLGGYVFEQTGSYDIIWLLSIALAVISTIVHLPILDRPLARLQAAI